MIRTQTLILPLALVVALAACSRDNDEATGGTSAADGATAVDATAADAGTPASTDAAGAPVDGTMAPGTDAGMTPGTGTDGVNGAAGTTAATGPANDADLLGVLAAIDQHEIDAAKMAKQKKLDAPVAKYADMMIADHTANLEQTRALGANDQSPQATAQKQEGKTHEEHLAATPDAEFQKAYVDAMVEGHTKALAALDGTLIPGVQDAKAKDHLQKTRAKVAQHLEQAKALQK